MNLDPNTPVLVGIGFADQRCDDPADAVEPYALMVKAVEAAAKDAGAPALLTRADRILVPRGMWEYSDPARLVANEIGARGAKTVLGEIGILQQTLINEACNAIAAGESKIAIVTGGEARYRVLTAGIQGKSAEETKQEGVAPDLYLQSDAPLWADLEAERTLIMPVEFYSIMEVAFRHASGLDVEAHRDQMAKLYERFSEIAVANPHAWTRERVSAAEIRDPVGKNRMISFPYTKLHNTSWNVDQASALCLCSVAVAEELGIAREHWVFPRAGTESNYAVPLAQRPEMHRSIGAEIAGRRAMELARVEPSDIAHVDLYSCFPAAVEIYAVGLGLGLDRDLTVTGGMPFAGGPLNNYVVQSTARMAEVLREDPGSVGLVSTVSGIIGKQGIAIWSTTPNPDDSGFGYADVTPETEQALTPVELVGDYVGPAVIAGYGVGYLKDTPVKVIAVCDLPDGRRSVVKAHEPALLEAMMKDEYCGREIVVAKDGSFVMAG